MKKINEFLRKIVRYLRKNPSEIIFGVYFFIILLIRIYFGYYYGNKLLGIDAFTLLLFYFAFSLTPKFHQWISKVSFSSPQDTSRKKKMQVFGIVGGITFIVLIFCFIGFYPGTFFADTIRQYEQVVKSSYNDWHPIWHTFLIFTLPLKLTGGWAGSIVLFQIIYFSLLMGYMAVVIYEYSGYAYTCLSVAFILLNPFTLELVMSPTKDVAFAMVAALSMLYAMNIYFTKGKWGDKGYRIVMLAFMLASATLFRHNGILFTLFLLVALYFFMQKKRWRLLVAASCIIFICIKVTCLFNVYSNNHEMPTKRLIYRRLSVETMGLPLSVIINVAKECPECLDKQTSDFVTELMCRQPDWKMRHNISGLNSVKWDESGSLSINEDAIEKAGFSGILRMMCYCFRVAPMKSFKAVEGLTIPVYGLEINGRKYIEIAPNDLGLKYNGIETICKVEDRYCSLVYNSPLRFIFTNGFTILVILAFILFKSNFRLFEDLERIFLCLPILTYNFGTMLLLSGPDLRYFYVSFLVCPLVVLIMAGKRV